MPLVNFFQIVRELITVQIRGKIQMLKFSTCFAKKCFSVPKIALACFTTYITESSQFCHVSSIRNSFRRCCLLGFSLPVKTYPLTLTQSTLTERREKYAAWISYFLFKFSQKTELQCKHHYCLSFFWGTYNLYGVIILKTVTVGTCIALSAILNALHSLTHFSQLYGILHMKKGTERLSNLLKLQR